MDLKNQFIYIVIDIPTQGILTRAKSLTTGRAITKGMLDTEVVPLPVNLASRYKEYADKNLYDGFWFYSGDDITISELSDHIKNDPAFLARKKLARKRHDLFYGLETYYQINLVRTFDYYDPLFDVYIHEQLALCKPEAGVFTDALQEMALISDIAVENMYQELKMRADTYGLIRARNYALYQKHVIKINSTADEDEMQAYYKQGIVELKKNASI